MVENNKENIIKKVNVEWIRAPTKITLLSTLIDALVVAGPFSGFLLHIIYYCIAFYKKLN